MPESTAVKAGLTAKFDGMTFDLARPVRRLIALILADKTAKKLFYTQELRYLESAWEGESEADIVSLLVEIATQYRLMVWNVSEKNRSAHYADEVVGVIAQEDKQEISDLKMRSACDKIIHAEEIVFDASKLRGAPYHFKNPLIHIYGKRGKISWEVSIDLITFCDAACRPISKDLFELSAGVHSE